jgi:F-type H+-transporting ATPase subunit a
MAGAEHHAPNPLHHVQDTKDVLPIFERLFGGLDIPLPKPIHIGGYEFHFTKFMLLELIAALILIAIYVPLAKRIKDGGLPKGWWWNMFEALFVFIRDEIARPYLDDPHAGHGHGHEEHKEEHHGHPPVLEHSPVPLLPTHTGDKFVPFLATQFLFILFLNLLGMIPFLGSPTASIWVTGGLALCSFIMLHAPGIAEKGLFGYFAGLWPHIDLGSGIVSKIVGFGFSLGIFVIELMGTFIKSAVLAVRLFANMFAGHMVLASILMFIWLVGSSTTASVWLWGGVSVASVLGSVALSLLELFVAFLQAYVFTFLTALFMGMSLHPEH